MPGWRYSLLSGSSSSSSSSSGGGGGGGGGGGKEGSPHPSQRSLAANARDCLNSKALWRIVLAVATLLLMGNLFFPARDQLRRYGYLLQAEEERNARENQELLHSDGAALDGHAVDWSDYAYCQYVTNAEYLCNSVMIFESLVRLGAKAERLMMFPEQWRVDNKTAEGALLVKARDEYGVRLMPVEVQHFDGDPTWADSFTKLLAFNQTSYKRVLSLDSDSTVLQPMDELFLLPPAPVAMPRAYWLDDQLSSQLVLVSPSDFEFSRIEEALGHRGSSDFDMEIANDLYGKDCFILPHRPYDLLTGEFKAAADKHAAYLGNDREVWDADAVLAEAKFLHFSDWPYPKPWLHASEKETAQNQPECKVVEDGSQDCSNREKWLWFYRDFRERRERVCRPAQEQ